MGNKLVLKPLKTEKSMRTMPLVATRSTWFDSSVTGKKMRAMRMNSTSCS